MHTLLYTESQPMLGMAIVILIIAALLIFVIYQLKKKTRTARILSVVALVMGGILLSILVTLRLETRYYTNTVEYQFGSVYMAPPEIVSLDSVASVSIITYNPTADYGGWGVRHNETTKVYNAAGDKGILFTFKRGKKLLLGTQQPDVLKTKLTGHYPLTN